jgi:hypothetical protein
MQLGLTMRHINRRLWENHKAEYMASYRPLLPYAPGLILPE